MGQVEQDPQYACAVARWYMTLRRDLASALRRALMPQDSE